MKADNKPFFFRVDVADLLNFATDPEGEGMTVLRFAKELQRGKSDIDFIQKVITEAREFKKKKQLAGSLGGKAKSSSAIAEPSGATAKPSIPLASSSSSSSSNNIKQQTYKQQPSLSLVEIQKVYSDTFKDLMPSTTIINRLQWFIDNFEREEILSAFEGASSAKVKSINWITSRFTKQLEAAKSDDELWDNLGNSEYFEKRRLDAIEKL